MDYRSKNLGGQTLIEVLVTTAVMVGLMSMLIVYNRTGQRIQTLSRVAEKAVFDIRKAQNFALTIREFQPGEVPCAYGVHFIAGTDYYTIFADRAQDCANADGRMDPTNEVVDRVALEEGIIIHSTNISDVTFRPPTADTSFHRPLAPGALAAITFSIGGDESFLRTVTINELGRVQLESP